jgi:hypothetical protein
VANVKEAIVAKPKGKTGGITGRHYLDFAQASSTQMTLTAYGKLIKNSETLPSAAGISHPHGLSELLQASLVYGVAIGGRCITLPGPQQVMLPAPDGRADDCGWDPTEYVVWRNLPREWVTSHISAERRTLSDALFSGLNNVTNRSVNAFALALPSVGERVMAIVKAWGNMTNDPEGSDQLQVLWAASHPGGSFGDGAKLLAQKINDAFGTQLQPTDLNPPDKIKTVDDLINAIT